MSIMMYFLRHLENVKYSIMPINGLRWSSRLTSKNVSPRMKEFREKLRQTSDAPPNRVFDKHPHQEKEPLESFENSTNPITGELGGPKGLEPTRYGDWERKGRVTDF